MRKLLTGIPVNCRPLCQHNPYAGFNFKSIFAVKKVNATHSNFVLAMTGKSSTLANNLKSKVLFEMKLGGSRVAHFPAIYKSPDRFKKD